VPPVRYRSLELVHRARLAALVRLARDLDLVLGLVLLDLG
jgi:hypothetical protein